MKNIVLAAALGVSSLATAASDWRIYEVTNATQEAYDVYQGTTDHEGGMNFINATKVGTIKAGKMYKLPAKDFTIKPTESKFKYLILRPLAPVKGKTRDIRVFFPLHQQGSPLPDDKNKKSYTIKTIVSNIAAGNDYLKHLSTHQGAAQFYGRSSMNAYLGVYIKPDGMPRFYSASDKHSTLPKTVVMSGKRVHQ